MSDILDVLARDLEPTLLRIFFVIFGGKDNILSQIGREFWHCKSVSFIKTHQACLFCVSARHDAYLSEKHMDIIKLM